MDRATWEFINSFAPWIAAVGTLAAVIVSLYLARQDRRIRLDVYAGIRILTLPLIDGKFPEYLVFHIVNISRREAQVKGISWMCNFHKVRVLHNPLKDGLSSELPIKLRDGEEANFFHPLKNSSYLDDIAKAYLSRYPRLLSYFIKIEVSTSVGVDFKVRIEKNLRERLVQTAKQLKKD